MPANRIRLCDTYRASAPSRHQAKRNQRIGTPEKTAQQLMENARLKLSQPM
jgi:hypothetical protein